MQARLCCSLFVTQLWGDGKEKLMALGEVTSMLLFPYYSAWCAVIYKFQSPAKGKLPFIVLAGVQALDVPDLRGQLALPWEGCQCLSSLPIGSDPLALQ